MSKMMKRLSKMFLILSICFSISANAAGVYTVKSKDSLYKISNANSVTISQLKQYNSLTSDMIYIGQKLALSPAVKYTVKSGDTLWLIAQRYSTTVNAIKTFNGLTSDMINIYQVLYIPTGKSGYPQAVTQWPSITYTVTAGDTVYNIAQKFGVTQANIIKYN